MTQDKDQMRAEFEKWAAPQADKNAIAKFDDGFYMSAKTSMAWAAWQAARANELERTEPPTHAMFKRVFRHGVVRDWKICSVEYANYILSNPERFGETEVRFLRVM